MVGRSLRARFLSRWRTKMGSRFGGTMRMRKKSSSWMVKRVKDSFPINLLSYVKEKSHGRSVAPSNTHLPPMAVEGWVKMIGPTLRFKKEMSPHPTRIFRRAYLRRFQPHVPCHLHHRPRGWHRHQHRTWRPHICWHSCLLVVVPFHK